MGSQVNMARMPIGKTDLKLETSKLDPKQRQEKGQKKRTREIREREIDKQP